MPVSLERYFQALQAMISATANVATFPHHKHDGDEEHVVAHAAPTLADVLLEIGTLLQPN
jgi:hypothetical protein